MTKNQSRMGEIQVEMGRNQLEMAEANVQIAQAVRNDSIPMRTIAYVTLVLLPGTFIAAIFGMNFFQFDTPSRTLIVAKSIWQYFVIAIPITIITIIIWNYWVRLETKKDARLTGDSRRFSTARNENIVAILEPTSSHEILPAEVAMKSRSGIQEFVRRLSGNKQTVDVELSPVS
ncbi:hypothetical protein BCR34DRAFT_48884 [Clohesyomyces aquaticus]|uniref:Uncharacterized protein n=1 Tax=Clohesyomyces aquaticus TaxID=1231657 RepID=A0A1Y1Z4H8_9PLEO|nr:hypothetical protein BCR34DRAFT_48884 [Clohesyomyces aquaticus]